MECAVSGRTVTCDVKKGRHVYLICRNPADPQKKLFLPESAVLDQVKTVLRSIQVPPKLLSVLLRGAEYLSGFRQRLVSMLLSCRARSRHQKSRRRYDGK